MVYKEIYFIGEENGKADADDFIIRYRAENGAYIDVGYRGGRVVEYRFLEKTFCLLETAINACDNHKLTVEEWASFHPMESYQTVWAADTNAGFGKKGDSVYGTSPGLYVVRDERAKGDKHILHMWHQGLGSMNKGYIVLGKIREEKTE